MSVDKLFKLGEKLFDKYFVKESSLTKVAEKLESKYLIKNAVGFQVKIDGINDPLDSNTIGKIQAQLRDLGFSPGAIDGRWGTNTQKALNRYEYANNLPESPIGTLNSATYTSLWNAKKVDSIKGYTGKDALNPNIESLPADNNMGTPGSKL